MACSRTFPMNDLQLPNRNDVIDLDRQDARRSNARQNSPRQRRRRRWGGRLFALGGFLLLAGGLVARRVGTLFAAARGHGDRRAGARFRARACASRRSRRAPDHIGNLAGHDGRIRGRRTSMPAPPAISPSAMSTSAIASRRATCWRSSQCRSSTTRSRRTRRRSLSSSRRWSRRRPT